MNESTKSLKIVVARNPPDAYDNCPKFPHFEPTVHCPFPGWTAEVNDTWTGMLGYVQRGEADTALISFQYVTSRAQYFTYSYPIFNVKVVYILKRKTTSIADGLWSVLVPFTWDTWIMILVSFLVQMVFGWFVRRMEHRVWLREESNFFETLWDYARCHLLQLEPKEYFFSTSGNFSFFMFNLLQVLMFTNLYTGILLTGLLKSHSDPFSSLENMVQLIGQGGYTMVTHKMAYKSNWYYSDLQNSNDTHFQQLREALERNPIIIKDTLSEALDLVQKGSYIYASQQDSSTIQLLNSKNCDLYYYDQGTPQKSAYFLFNNNSTIIEDWNEAINKNTEFISRTFSKYFVEGFIAGQFPKCKEAQKDDEDQDPDAYKPFGIEAMFAVIFIMLICFGVSLLVFAAEHYINWQAKVIRLKFQTRRALMEPINLMGIASACHQINQESIQEVLDKEASRRASEDHSLGSDFSRISIV